VHDPLLVQVLQAYKQLQEEAPDLPLGDVHDTHTEPGPLDVVSEVPVVAVLHGYVVFGAVREGPEVLHHILVGRDSLHDLLLLLVGPAAGGEPRALVLRDVCLLHRAEDVVR